MTIAGLLIALPLTSGADGRSYTGDKNVTHDCAAEPEVSINTGDATVVVKGTCAKISINGGSNKVTLDGAKTLSVNGSTNRVIVVAADKISVTGSDNQVTYKKGLSAAKPKVSAMGSGNQVTQAK
ncbi:MAG: DUF3060 domain-containing protein [Kofleriaceae bacterium]|nr:DUF3060 domain-containing protein [Kofleriaceae bacterium]